MELSTIVFNELNMEYDKYIKRIDRRTLSFFKENKHKIDIHISLLEGKYLGKYLRYLIGWQIDNEYLRVKNGILKNFSDDTSDEMYKALLENKNYHQELKEEYIAFQKAIEEGKQEAPDKPQEQAKEAPKERATAKVKGRSKADILRIYQAMEKAGFIEAFPTIERLIELHFEGDEPKDIRGSLSSQKETERVQSTSKYHKFIMAIVTMAYNNENIKHLEKLRNEIDDYIEKLETTHSKYS